MKQTWIDDQGFGVVPPGGVRLCDLTMLSSQQVCGSHRPLIDHPVSVMAAVRRALQNDLDSKTMSELMWKQYQKSTWSIHDGDVDDENTFMSNSHFTW